MRLTILASALLTVTAVPAVAQQEEPADPAAAANRVNQLIVYGDDDCPPSNEDEIIVCARLPEDERFRIPPGLRHNPNDPAGRSWRDRAIELSYVGRTGIGSCSPVGPGGFVGCHNELVRQARDERQQSGIDWGTLVEEARRNRARRIDRTADEIERQQADDDD
ncbi:hypothetical protein [Allosphingosinicella sp.]|jgi:hypothetical protein|uniref:hypothetical protein n=1 Tax=Allosphingosinicella sp. TaxID=2823234 RepID=UPI002F1A6277